MLCSAMKTNFIIILALNFSVLNLIVRHEKSLAKLKHVYGRTFKI